MMQAIILAAGYGKRLKPLTDQMPKALVEVNGKSLLENSLDHLATLSVDEVILVVGHFRDMIYDKIGTLYKGMKITYVDNPVYRETNNVYSFYLTKDYINDDVIMLECDLYFNRDLIEEIIKTQAECIILVSPYNKETMDGTIIRADGVIASALVTKKFQGHGFDYEGALKTVNIYKFSKDFIRNHFMPQIETYVKHESLNSYYELVLGSLIYYGNRDIRVMVVDESKWAEIDDLDDLERAKRAF